MTLAPFHHTVDSRRISRKLTISVEHTVINVRPIVKGAIKEASHTMTEAYASDPVLGWCCGGLDVIQQNGEILSSAFKHMIDSATLQSRDYALQVEGCKGVIVWTSRATGLSWPRMLGTTKLARLLGWSTALRALVKLQPWCDKMHRLMRDRYPDMITIGYLGVLPHEQRKGLGTALLQHVLNKADDAHRPVYAEATDQAAIAFFERHGFTIEINTLVCNREGMPVALMIREPRQISEPKPLRLKPGRRDSDNTL